MPGVRTGAGVVLGILLIVHQPSRAEATEAGIDLTGLIGAGYDSNYSLLGSARNVPPPFATGSQRSAGMWMLEAGAVGWLAPVDAVELTLEPDFRLIHFFDNELLVEPGVDLSVYVRPVPVLALGIGGGYRYYRFSYFLEDRFHEPHTWFELLLTPGDHRLSFLYSFAYRSMPPDNDPPDTGDVEELEHRARFSWRILMARIVTLGIAFEYDHVRGTEGWMQEDALKAVLGLEVAWRMIDAGVAYVPGVMWLENEGMGLLNRVSVWVGARYPEWIRYGLEYRYDDLMEIHRIADEIPYERHLVLFTLTFTWGASTPGYDASVQPDPGGEGEVVAVSAGHATFRVRAPDASSVSLAGSFNGWQTPGPDLEGPDGDGMWTLELDLEPGRHEIVYVVDGETVTPENAPAYAADGFGGKNAVIHVP
jgi:hypothetical protein